MCPVHHELFELQSLKKKIRMRREQARAPQLSSLRNLPEQLHRFSDGIEPWTVVFS
jgi:hypothetical protein